MTLAIRWSHEAGENARPWPHESGVWQAARFLWNALRAERQPNDSLDAVMELVVADGDAFYIALKSNLGEELLRVVGDYYARPAFKQAR